MQGMNFEIFIFFALLASCCGANQDVIDRNLVNNKVERTIDLTTHLPKMSTVITIENTGSSSVKSFLFAVDNDLSAHLSIVAAVVSLLFQSTILLSRLHENL